MIHWRRRVIDGLKAAVRGAPTPSAVLEWNGRAVEDKHSTWIAVVPTEESPDDETTTQDSQGVLLSVDMVAGARNPEMRDQISMELQEALERSPLQLTWTGTRLSAPDVEGKHHVFESIHSYTVRYQHSFESPATE